MDTRTDSGEFYPGGDRRGGDPIDLTFDDAVTRTSARAVKSSGIWGAIWGALAALPTGVASLYDWCVAQLAGKLSTSGGIVHGLLESSEPLGQSFTGLGVNGMVGYYGGIRWGLRIGTGDNVDFPVLLNKNGGEIVVPSAVGTMALLSDIPDVTGKASAADLRYALVAAPVVTTYSVPDSWFPMTFTNSGTAYTVQLMDKDMIVVNDGYLEYHGLNGEFVSMAYFNGAVLNVIAPDVWSLQINGVTPVEGETALDATATATLADRASNRVTPADASALTLPPAVAGHMRDLIVDVDNSAGASDIDLELASDATAYLDAGGARYLVAVADGDDLADLLTVAAGARARLYFTETAQTATPAGGTEAVPVISLQRLTVVVGGAA